ncbi:MAG: MFS transporter, partial [Candidatus Bathyarchaeota archaeon]|nr:MFS transporter [Candidatus Bathyarchaeota archaeon]
MSTPIAGRLSMKTGIRGTISGFFKDFDRRAKTMLAAIGLYNLSSGLPSRYAQLYITALGAKPLELGSLSSIGSIFYCLVSAPMGWFIDKHGVKRAVILGLAVSAIVSGIYGIASSWLMLIPAMVLYQIGFRTIYSLPDMVFVETIKPERRAQAMGFARTIWAIPSILAPIMAAAIVTAFGGINAEGIRP